MIIGVKEDILFENRSLMLNRGDILLLYTDGVTEASSLDGELFGIERLAQILAANHEESLQDIIEHIYREVISFSDSRPLSDDVTMVALRIGQSVFDHQD
jgi:sigma-B regulation protein RsbU (phosphoserine phosphatase)